MDFSRMDVLELRRQARQKGAAALTVATASRERLIEILTQGEARSTVSDAVKARELAAKIPARPEVAGPIAGPVTGDPLALAIANAVKGYLTAEGIDEAAVRKLVQAEIAGLSKTITVKLPDGTKIEIGKQHEKFSTLLHTVSAGVNVWLAGPAGSGKTTAAQNVAKALGLPFYFNGAIDNEYKLLGFTDAQGRIVSRPFREAFINGGVYLFDEVDASLPSAVLAFNAALANSHCDFPDGCFPKHKNFRAIGAANTVNGQSTKYVGRMKQDAAFLDRFVTLLWEYDEQLEREIAGNLEWTRFVQRCRANAVKHGLDTVISPRASINGAVLLAQGELSRETIIDMTIRRGLSEEAWRKISA